MGKEGTISGRFAIKTFLTGSTGSKLRGGRSLLSEEAELDLFLLLRCMMAVFYIMESN